MKDWMDIESYQSCTIPKQHFCHINKSVKLQGMVLSTNFLGHLWWALGIAGIMLGDNPRKGKGPLAHSKCTNMVLLANDTSY